MINWTPNNLAPHQELVKTGQPRGPQGRLPDRAHRTHGHCHQLPHVRHSCRRHRPGHAAFSTADCRSHDVDNLYVVDGSFFPSSAALNPALTIAANALRVAPIAASIRS